MTTPAASTLTAWRVGGQLDESVVVPAGYEYADLVVTATLAGADGAPVIDATNDAVVLDGPYTTVVGGTPRTATTDDVADGEGTLAGRYWWTEKLKATTAIDPADALQPTGLSWTIALQVIGRRGQFVELRSWSVTLDADRDYETEAETVTLDTSETEGGGPTEEVVNITALIAPPTTTPAAEAFVTAVDSVVGQVSASAHGVSTSATAAANATGLLAAMEAAWVAGTTVKLPEGVINTDPVVFSPSAVNQADGVLRVDAVGTTLKPASGDAISITSTWGTGLAVSAVVLEDAHAFPLQLTAKNATKLTLPTGHGLAIGDIVKVTSEDAVTDIGRFTIHSGAFETIADVSGDDVWVSSVLRVDDTWTTTLKVWTVPDASLEWVGGGFDLTDGSMGLVVTGFTRPRVADVVFETLGDTGIHFVACYSPEASNVSGKAQLGLTARYPYLVTVSHSESGVFTGLKGTRCRHTWTTAGGNTTPDDPHTYGRSAHHVVADSQSVNCLGGFDTHQDAYDVTFANCKSINALSGEDTRGAGFSIRGRHVTCRGCTVFGAVIAYLIFAETQSKTSDIRLEGCVSRWIEENAINAAVATGDGQTMDLISVSGGDYESEKYALIVGSAGTALVDGGRWKVRDGFWRPIQANLASTRIRVRGADVFMSASASAVFYAVASATVEAYDCTVHDLDSAQYLVDGPGTIEVHSISALGVSPTVSDLGPAFGTGFAHYFDGLDSTYGGTSNITTGNTSVVVTHGLGYTPAVADLMVTAHSSLGSATNFWVDTITSTQFTINVDADPVGTVVFGWQSTRVR